MVAETSATPEIGAQARTCDLDLDALIAGVGDGITIQNASGALVRANAQAARLLGFATAEELIAAPPTAILARFEMFDEHGRVLPPQQLPGRLAMQGGTFTRLVRFRMRATSEDRWSHVSATQVRSREGVAYVVNTFRDAPEVVLGQRAERGDARMSALFESISDPFTIYDEELRIVNINEAAAKLIGSRPEDLVGKRPWEVVGGEEDERWSRHRAVLRSRLAASDEIYMRNWDRWYESTIYPIDHGIAVYARDVTMRKRAVELAARLARHTTLRAEVSASLADERDLRAMLRRCCESLVEHLGVAFARVWTLDAEGDNLLLQASAGMYTHIDGAHGVVPVGKFKIGMIAAERRPHLTNDIQNDPRLGDPEWARREGLIAFAGYPLLVDGKLVGVLAMFAREAMHEDTLYALGAIADTIAQGIMRRRTQLELEQRVTDLARSNADLEQFAYVASHDLQEPLRMVASYNQLIARRYKGKLGEDADEFIGYTVEGVSRMQRLINDLLAYSRVGTRGNERIEIDMEKVLKIALANLEHAIGETRASITSDPLPFVRGDEGQLIQLMQNLIGNAIKFHGDQPPRVHIGVGHNRDGITFSVQDNGIGIDPQYFDRIFVIFQRLHPREKYPGTGIGLAICKKIVERHGGRIWVESTPGRGSTILFTMPARPQ